MWEFIDLESERKDSVCWSNNKIIDKYTRSCSLIIHLAEVACLAAAFFFNTQLIHDWLLFF